jgi:ribonucleotide monophosphatase NagD (HAD superfamily)
MPPSIPDEENNNDNSNHKYNHNRTCQTTTSTTSVKTVTRSNTFQAHTSVTESIINQYDGFILDQFGVLHNGVDSLDGAAELVKVLAKQYKKRLVILSNSSSSSDTVQARLPTMGFDPKDLLGVVTSGEEAGQYIRRVYNNNNETTSSGVDSTTATATVVPHQILSKKKALFITWKTSSKSTSAMDFLTLCGGDIPLTDNPEEADYVILHGIDVILHNNGGGGRGCPHGNNDDNNGTDHEDDNNSTIERRDEEISLGDFFNTGNITPFEPILQHCADRNLPMICANMDSIMVQPNGQIGHMPGKIAQRYSELGGTYIGFGKPYVDHFEACVRLLDLPKHKVVHVGDSLHHDVAGANGCGIDSIFVTGGIHRTELGTNLGVLPTKESLVSLFEQYGQTPTHVVPMFRL